MFRIINKLKNRKGFTLIELIVVLAVLSIIMSIAVPRFLGVQEEAKNNADLVTLNMIASAAELYFAQHSGETEAKIDELNLSEFSMKGTTYASVDETKITVTYDKTSGKVSVWATDVHTGTPPALLVK